MTCSARSRNPTSIPANAWKNVFRSSWLPMPRQIGRRKLTGASNPFDGVDIGEGVRPGVDPVPAVLAHARNQLAIDVKAYGRQPVEAREMQQR